MGKPRPPVGKTMKKLGVSSVDKKATGSLSRTRSGLSPDARSLSPETARRPTSPSVSPPPVSSPEQKKPKKDEKLKEEKPKKETKDEKKARKASFASPPVSPPPLDGDYLSGEESRPMSPMSVGSDNHEDPSLGGMERPSLFKSPADEPNDDYAAYPQAHKKTEVTGEGGGGGKGKGKPPPGNYGGDEGDDIESDYEEQQEDDALDAARSQFTKGKGAASRTADIGKKKMKTLMGKGNTVDSDGVKADLASDEKGPSAWRHNRGADRSFAPMKGTMDKIGGMSPATRFLNDPEIRKLIETKNFTPIFFHKRWIQLVDEQSGGPGPKDWNAWSSPKGYWACGKLIKHITNLYELPNAKTQQYLKHMDWRELMKCAGFTRAMTTMRPNEQEKAIRCLTGSVTYYAFTSAQGASGAMSYTRKKKLGEEDKPVEEEEGLKGKTLGRFMKKGAGAEKQIGDKVKMQQYCKDVVVDTMVERGGHFQDVQRRLLSANFADIIIADDPFVEILLKFVDRYPAVDEGGTWDEVSLMIKNELWAELLDSEQFISALKNAIKMYKAKAKLGKLKNMGMKNLKKAAKGDLSGMGAGADGGEEGEEGAAEEEKKAELCWASGRDREGKLVVVLDVMQLPVYDDTELVEEAVDKVNSLLDQVVDGSYVCVATYDNALVQASETTVTNVFNAVQNIYKYLGRRYMSLLSTLYIVHPKREYNAVEAPKFKGAAKKLAQQCETFAQKTEHIWCVLDLYEAIRHEQINLPPYTYTREYEKKVEVRISVRELRQLKTSMTKALNEKRKIAEEILSRGVKLSEEHRREVQKYLAIDPAFENRYKKFKQRLPSKEENDSFVLCESGEIVFLLRNLSLEMHNRERMRIIDSVYKGGGGGGGGKRGSTAGGGGGARGSVAGGGGGARGSVAGGGGGVRGSITGAIGGRGSVIGGSGSKKPEEMDNAEAARAATEAVNASKKSKFGFKRGSKV